MLKSLWDISSVHIATMAKRKRTQGQTPPLPKKKQAITANAKFKKKYLGP
jgi:hypothetical protein